MRSGDIYRHTAFYIDAAGEIRGTLSRVAVLPTDLLRAVIECVAGADDTTRRQEQPLRDTLAALR